MVKLVRPKFKRIRLVAIRLIRWRSCTPKYCVQPLQQEAMKAIEPAFDRAGEFWAASLDAPQKDVGALEDTIARQSAELNLRLTEVLELHTMQSRQATELEVAHEEINRLKQTISELRAAASQQRIDAAAAQDAIASLENHKADLREQLARTRHEMKALEVRMAAFDASKANTAAALKQISDLNSELTMAAAERFKLVATVHGEKRRHNQQTTFWQDKIKNAEAMVETREMQVKHLQDVRSKLDERIQVLEALLESEREVAERKIARLTDELERCRSSSLAERALPLISGT
jgi:chromosome segregation ATPase